jgi:hypothetical protein
MDNTYSNFDETNVSIKVAQCGYAFNQGAVAYFLQTQLQLVVLFRNVIVRSDF